MTAQSGEKSLWGETRTLLKMATPLLIAQLAQMGTGVVDTIMAGHYSSVDLAAIAIGYNIWLPIYLMALGVMLAVTSIVAQLYGAGRIRAIGDALPQALWLSLILGVVSAPLCYFPDPLLNLLSLDETTHTKAREYLQAVAFGLPAAAIFQALRCHTQGVGILRPFAIASVIGFIANIPLNYAFIYGYWGIPEMGAAGCGWATAISMWLGPVLIAFYIVRSEELRPYLPKNWWQPPRGDMLREISWLGIPIGLTFFLEVAVFSIISLFIATMGNTAMAAHQIAFNVYDVLYMPLISIGSAMTTLVGQAIGRKDLLAVRRTIQAGTAVALLFSLFMMAMMLGLPDAVARLYTEDQEIRTLAVALLKFAAVFVMFDAIQVVASFSLRAFKDTRFPFFVMIIAYWLIALPVGYWLGMNADNITDGTIGFWWGMIAGIAVAAALDVWRLLNWLKKPVEAFPDVPTDEIGLA